MRTYIYELLNELKSLSGNTKFIKYDNNTKIYSELPKKYEIIPHMPKIEKLESLSFDEVLGFFLDIINKNVIIKNFDNIDVKDNKNIQNEMEYGTIFNWIPVYKNNKELSKQEYLLLYNANENSVNYKKFCFLYYDTENNISYNMIRYTSDIFTIKHYIENA